jgi:hypothetical protein
VHHVVDLRKIKRPVRSGRARRPSDQASGFENFTTFKPDPQREREVHTMLDQQEIEEHLSNGLANENFREQFNG